MQTSIIKYSELREASHSYRWDAEFFDPRVLANETLIEKRNSCLFDVLIEEITGGATPLGANYPTKGIPFLRVQNIMQNYINLSDIVYITEKDHNILFRSKLQKNDILLTITGVSYGKSAVVMDENIGSNINQHSVRIKIREINPFYLSTFLNCKYGYMQSTKNIVGITRPALDYTSIKKFIIPIFSDDFQKSIEVMVLTAHDEREKANRLTKEAETLLEKELKIYEWTPPKEALNISIKKHSETKTANRIDAEYYQPKYEAILQKITSYKGGYKTLGKLIEKYSTGFAFDSKQYSDEGVPVVRINNIKKGELDLSNPAYVNKIIAKGAQKDIIKTDNLLISMSGTIGSCCKVQRGQTGIINQRILRMETKEYNQDVLTLIINSNIGSSQLDRIGTGGVQTNISSGDMFNIKIPIIDETIQNEIAEKITASYKARQESKRLLELAKSTVENAIENGE